VSQEQFLVLIIKLGRDCVDLHSSVVVVWILIEKLIFTSLSLTFPFAFSLDLAVLAFHPPPVTFCFRLQLGGRRQLASTIRVDLILLAVLVSPALIFLFGADSCPGAASQISVLSPRLRCLV
jgi:hypothetical protein